LHWLRRPVPRRNRPVHGRDWFEDGSVRERHAGDAAVTLDPGLKSVDAAD
jgi:hypothetical protein